MLNIIYIKVFILYNIFHKYKYTFASLFMSSLVSNLKPVDWYIFSCLIAKKVLFSIS